MKTYCTFLLALLCSLFAWAQGDFVKENTSWVVSVSYETVFEELDWGNARFEYYVDGDTIIDGRACKRFYVRVYSWETSVLLGALEEEDGKVWLNSRHEDWEASDFRILLYDFTCEVGDVIRWDQTLMYYGGYSGGEIDHNPYACFDEPRELMVEAVTYRSGRKVIRLNNGDAWIEGIGSIHGCWGAMVNLPTGHTTDYYSMHQVVTDGQCIYQHGRVVDPDYAGTFLCEGKVWYIDSETGFVRMSLGACEEVRHYPMYKLYRGDEAMGYLYDVNGTIFWDVAPYSVEDLLLYDFKLKEGDQIRLAETYGNTQGWDYPVRYETYTVTEVGYTEGGGQQLKTLHLDGSTPLVWIEDVGSTRGPIYMKEFPKGKMPVLQLTCCYAGDELLYHDPDYADCERKGSAIDEEVSLSGTFRYEDGCLLLPEPGDEFSVYDAGGRLVCSRRLAGAMSVGLRDVLSPGAYLCRFKGASGKEVVHKLVVE